MRKEKEFTLSLLIIMILTAVIVADISGVYLFHSVEKEIRGIIAVSGIEYDDTITFSTETVASAVHRVRLKFIISELAYSLLLMFVALIAAKRIIRTYHQRKLQLESTLFRQQHDFRHLVDSLGEIVYTLSIDGKFTFINQKGCELLETEQPDYYEKEFCDFVHPEDKETVKKSFLRAKEGLRENRAIFRLVSGKDHKKERIVEMSSIPLVESGKKVGIVGLIRDLSARIEMEKTIEESKRLLEVTFDSITDGIIVIDSDMRIEMTNRTEKEHLELLTEDFKDKPCYKIYGNRDTPCPGCAAVETFKTGRSNVMEFARDTGENDKQYIATYAYPLTSDEEGSVDRVVVFIRDVTEQKKLQLRLLESARMATIGEMAAVMAHEIRTPLISIGGYARSIRKNLSEDNPAFKKISIVISEVERLERFLKDQLDFAGPMRPELTLSSIHKILDEILDFYKDRMKDAGIECIKNYDRSIPDFMLDPNKLHRALLNIIQNALDAMENGNGLLTVNTKKHANSAIIKISDTGNGIPEKMRDSIMEPFTTGKNGGTGLGLPIALRIFRLHGGEMVFDSKEGKGTTVYITLPILSIPENKSDRTG